MKKPPATSAKAEETPATAAAITTSKRATAKPKTAAAAAMAAALRARNKDQEAVPAPNAAAAAPLETIEPTATAAANNAANAALSAAAGDVAGPVDSPAPIKPTNQPKTEPATVAPEAAPAGLNASTDRTAEAPAPAEPSEIAPTEVNTSVDRTAEAPAPVAPDTAPAVARQPALPAGKARAPVARKQPVKVRRRLDPALAARKADIQRRTKRLARFFAMRSSGLLIVALYLLLLIRLPDIHLSDSIRSLTWAMVGLDGALFCGLGWTLYRALWKGIY